ncbi:MAG: TetR/AcrR family transcriptional regulator [Chloroflexota bacterium]
MKPDNIIPINSNKPIRADAIRNRRLLLDTAQALFDEHGIQDVTMSAIAKEAGVGKGTLYRHFTDKADLCHALLDEDMRKFQQETLTHLRDCAEPYDGLYWFLEESAQYVVRHNDLLIEVANQGGVDMLSHPAHVWWRQTIVGLLARLTPDADTSYLADMLYIMLDVQTIRFQRRVQNYSVERIINGLHMLLAKITT